MSQSRSLDPNRATAGATSEPTVPTSEVLELLNDDHASEIIRRIHDEAKSARELAEECEMSRATAYRRLNRLDDAGLVDVGMTYDPDGYHRKIFELAVSSVSIELDDGSLQVDVSMDEPV